MASVHDCFEDYQDCAQHAGHQSADQPSQGASGPRRDAEPPEQSKDDHRCPECPPDCGAVTDHPQDAKGQDDQRDDPC